MSVMIGPLHSNPISMNLSLYPKLNTPVMQKITQEVNAGGRVAVAEQSFQAAMGHVSNLLAQKNIQVSTVFDGINGIQVSLVDGDSGRQITQMPPEAVVQMAQKSKEQNIGWIIDRLL